MNMVYIQGVGLLGPGLSGWQDSQPVLTQHLSIDLETFNLPIAGSLPANERRRASRLSKMVLYVAEEAFQKLNQDGHTGTLPAECCSVFASSCGDLEIVDKICRALAMADKPVSPIQFHNSVHNAQAGYWAIANQVKQASVSLSAYTGSFAAGLLEAMTVLNVEQKPVLLLAYDRPAPQPLYSAAPSQYEFAVAILLTPEKGENPLGSLNINIKETDQQQTQLTDSNIEILRMANPAARSLPLLQLMANQHRGQIRLPYLDELDLELEFEPC